MSIEYPDLPLTNFPQNNDIFISYLNISATDASLVNQYFTAIQAGNTALAAQIFSQIPQGSQKILTAQGLNKFNQCIIALQRFYGTDIQPYITQKQVEWQGIIDEFNYQGYYSATTQYVINNYVSYNLAGVTNLYIAFVKPPIGTLPTNINYWRVLTIRGLQGTSGAGLSFMGNWSSEQPYSLQDCVTDDYSLWGCLIPNTNQKPFIGSTYWQLIYEGGVTIYPVSASQPSAQQDGALWFQIIT